ncbi:polysaccharide deacetylase family protein [Candidatus Saccharibacteria bacterium]|nr:polysaccharide deacetylase family protein [Candidatus Saccharibacteria bacterium]
MTRSKSKAKRKLKAKALPQAKAKLFPQRRLIFLGLLLIVTAAIYAVVTNWPAPTGTGIYTGYPLKLRQDLAKLQNDVHSFNSLQARNDASLVAPGMLAGKVSNISLQAASGQYIAAETNIKQLEGQLGNWRGQLSLLGSGAVVATVPTPTPFSSVSPSGLFIPIVIYHYTPADFNDELDYLQAHNYTVIDLKTVYAALTLGGPLPAKPVVLTFDDGFENQMQAFDMLKAHNMKATYYIINGGTESRWCIGAGRRYNDPMQPAAGCGDAYLSWNQIRLLDASGLITIGGHSLNHLELATLPVDEQRHEIADSKTAIEHEIGHSIYDFSYPYGNYDSDTVKIVAAAGYRTAVTTSSGEYQLPGYTYTLSRIRTTIGLP